MGQSVAVILIIIFLVFLFIPMAFLTNNQQQVGEIKQSLNLSAKALIKAIEVDSENANGFSQGYNRGRQQEVVVNKEDLLREFYDILYRNYYIDGGFQDTKQRLVLKILVVNDRFYLAKEDDQWSHPYFFLLEDTGLNVYLDIRDDIVYYYDDYGNMTYASLQSFGISKEEKNQRIINRINQVVAMETKTEFKDGLEIMIQNSQNVEGDYRRRFQNFNVLEGITFFVIYRGDTGLEINNQMYEYKNYNVVGYTLRSKV
ncbi:hypothetical protein [Alkaliphilus hydrothermalis]|uniref:Uncharacterized protein n=1 Tax=Alkaliphilus hydrothermalis TaxID=1482730 RepID=A0ABS2NKY9_9FIRM|nr:hypothetical protein [Alkaliphilus hydrothermalis]MBM7613603.1 hypothetical protein [Alkaliphilus hydrothermalis]